MEEEAMSTPPQAIDSIHLSLGTAALLGLLEVPMEVAPTTAYLMLGGRCRMNCAFCAQARDSQAGALNLSRITWPRFELADVLPQLVEASAQGAIRRACLQCTVTPNVFAETLFLVRAVKAVAPELPFDVSILPHDLAQVRDLFDAGVDHLGFGLDAACERVFHTAKGRSWARSLRLIEETARAFPGKAALHLIAGLGETEQEMVGRLAWAHQRGIVTGLFAFTPVRGTAWEGHPPPNLAAYRRVQAARWLIVHGIATPEQMAFDSEGRLVRISAPGAREALAGGRAFETSGCPDCNRPFYNERPGGPLYNYPRPLAPEEAAQAVEALGLFA
jgi:biotin synthase-related radical SAM superfamily protein